MIARSLEFLARHATAVMASGVFIGLAWPALAAWLRPLLVPAVFLLLVAALLRQDWSALFGELRRPLQASALFLWLMIGTPLLTLGVVTVLQPPPALATALVFMAASAPLISCIPLALLLGFDATLSTVVTLAATLLLPLYLPPLALGLLGLDLQVGVGVFMLRLATLVIGSLVVALVIRRLARPARLVANADRIDGLNVFFLLVFAIAIMDGVTDTLVARPALVALYAGSAFAANLGLQAVGTLAFLWLGRARALTCGLLSGNRNMAILIAAMAGQAEFDVLLFFAIGQLPIYILPAVLRPVYRRIQSGGQPTA